tara:strand:+ start:252 stop:692 length:441 start_codon:yes stop_codon:yes gene_type:complete
LLFSKDPCISSGRRAAILHIISAPTSFRSRSLLFFDFDNSKGPKGFPILILTDGRTPLNIISQAFSKPVIPTGSRRVFPVAERKAAPFFAGRRTLDKDVPSGKIPKISPFLSARIEFFIVEGAKLLRSVGINPYINGAQINCVSIT